MSSKITFGAAAALAASALLLASPTAHAQSFQTVYFIPLPENEVLETLDDVNAATDDPVQTYVSITVPAACTIHYDHWEDGYEADIATPAQATTEIWGDGNPANGAPPAIPGDVLGPGSVILLDNLVTTGMITGDEDPNLPANDAPLQATVDFDGRDRFAATCASAVTRAAWGDSGTVNAGAAEVWPVSDWGTQYVLPVGEDTPQADSNFEVTNVSVMAANDGTSVDIDHDADGVVDLTVVLNAGETYYLDSSSLDVNQGATVTATNVIQVNLATGDANSSFEGRWYALPPEERWDSCYYSPTNEQPNSGVRLFLFNASPDATDVTATDGNGNAIVITVPAGSSATYDMPTAAVGAELCSNDGTRFQALAAVDHGDVTHDWGYMLVPGALLTNQLLIPWADGCDPTQACTENGSPIWVTPVCDTVLYVDFDQDGTPDEIDLNGDGDATDTNVDGLDETTSASGLALSALERVLIHDPTDGNQTGALIFTLDSMGNPPGCDIAAVWGQNSAVASTGAPAIDVGTWIAPFGPDIRLEKSTNGEDADDPADAALVAPGGAVTWQYEVSNVGDFSFTNLVVTDDQLPDADITCDASQVGDGADVNGDNTIDLLHPGEVVICQAMGTATLGLYSNTGSVIGLPISSNGTPILPPLSDDDPSHYFGTDPGLAIDKQPAVLVDDADSSSSITLGDRLEWTILVSNIGNIELTNVTVTDSIADTLVCERADTSAFDHVGGDTLAVGEIITCIASKVVTATDVAAGQIVNTATADSDETPPVDDTETTPTAAMSACQKGSVDDVLDPVFGRFPGNAGEDVLVRVDFGESVQAAIDDVTANGDLNGDGYLIIFVEHSDGFAGGHTTESIVIDASYALPFALIGCGTTLHDANPGDGAPTAHVTANASSPDLFIMDLYADDSDAEGWLVEGNGRTLRNIRALKNQIGIRIVGDGNLLDTGVEIGWNDVAGLSIEGNGNEVRDSRVESNGVGIDVSGNGNVIRKNDVGNCQASNAADGIVVSGDGNELRENRVFANYGHGIVVSGTGNLLAKNDSGDDGKGNFGAGIFVMASGQADLDENRAQGNLEEGFRLDGGGNMLSSNDSGGSSVSDANFGCEYLAAAGNVNGGGNRENGSSVNGNPFPTSCVGLLLSIGDFESCAGIASPPTYNGGSGGSGGGATSPGVLTVTTTKLKTGKVGKAFKRKVVAKGGLPPYSWTAVGLPLGLTFDPIKAKIASIPQEDGFFPATFEVTDLAGDTATVTLTVPIAPNVPYFKTTALKNGAVGKKYSQTVKVKDGVKPWTWSSPNLPAWLTLDPAKGKLQGTPIAAGDYVFDVSVVDAFGQTDLVTLTITVP